MEGGMGEMGVGMVGEMGMPMPQQPGMDGVGQQMPLPEGARSIGTVRRWTNDRGFGFIAPEDGGEDLFCHFSNIVGGNALIQDGQVEFVKVYDDRKGKERAEQVTGTGVTTNEGGGGGGMGMGMGGGLGMLGGMRQPMNPMDAAGSHSMLDTMRGGVPHMSGMSTMAYAATAMQTMSRETQEKEALDWMFEQQRGQKAAIKMLAEVRLYPFVVVAAAMERVSFTEQAVSSTRRNMAPGTS